MFLDFKNIIFFGSIKQNVEMTKNGKILNTLIFFSLLIASICISMLTSCNYIGKGYTSNQKNCDQVLLDIGRIIKINSLYFQINHPIVYSRQYFLENYKFELSLNNSYIDHNQFLFQAYDIKDNNVMDDNKKHLQMVPYGQPLINKQNINKLVNQAFQIMNISIDNNNINCIEPNNNIFIIFKNDSCLNFFNTFIQQPQEKLNNAFSKAMFIQINIGVSTFCHNCYYSNYWTTKDIQTLFTNTFSLFTTFYSIYTLLYLLFFKLFRNQELELILQNKIFELENEKILNNNF
jgi:hypothetical protein